MGVVLGLHCQCCLHVVVHALREYISCIPEQSQLEQGKHYEEAGYVHEHVVQQASLLPPDLVRSGGLLDLLLCDRVGY